MSLAKWLALTKIVIPVIKAIIDISQGKASKRYIRYRDVNLKIKRKEVQ